MSETHEAGAGERANRQQKNVIRHLRQRVGRRDKTIDALRAENRDAALQLGEDTGTDPEFCELPGQVSAILTMLRLQKQIIAERDSSLDFAAEKITKHYNRTVKLEAALALAQTRSFP